MTPPLPINIIKTDQMEGLWSKIVRNDTINFYDDFLFQIVYLDDSTRILFLSMYRILLFLMGRGHERSLSVRRVGGRGSTPLLACGCTILLGLGLGVPCQTPEVDGFEASLLHPFKSSMELLHFLVHLGQGFFDVGVPHCRLCGGGCGGSQFLLLFYQLL